MKTDMPYVTYGQMIWQRFCQNRLSLFFLVIVALFALIGIYAPLLASSKPLVVYFQSNWYFPLLRYLFYSQFFSKPLDLFYNLAMFTLPLFLASWFAWKHKRRTRLAAMTALFAIHNTMFILLMLFPLQDPAFDRSLAMKRKSAFAFLSWEEEKKYLSSYAQLNLLLRYQQAALQKEKWQPYEAAYADLAKEKGRSTSFFPSLWNFYIEPQNRLQENKPSDYSREKKAWMEKEVKQLKFELWPLLRVFHPEEEAGGDALLNELVPWYELTRLNRKDMMASLIFGIRISLSVGLLSVFIALSIAIPVGALSGYFGGKLDLLLYRLIEIWESMPTFFMLLSVIAFMQTKSIFLMIVLIALFGWTTFSRFIRGEFLRQKKLLYVEACYALGYGDAKIIFCEILPNAITPLLSLVPFAIMGAITSEAALSFLGLGEEGSNSWGVLMDEGRSAFPSQSYLLWPPALLLTLLLIAIANVGEGIRNAIDPKS